ncbi:MAG: sugar phosphate isomerase/epimerase, partial [Calditrichaeota bacterium]|nr:sugar phosphate isomerase/epimerase [Calditrichota bacterium]
RYVEVAAGLGAPFVRLFGGTIPDGVSQEEAVKMAAERLRGLADLASEAGIAVVVESHDSFSRGRDLRAVLQAAEHPAANALWDVFNSQIPGGETLAESYEAIRPWLRHTHIKDGVIESGHWEYTPMGEGRIAYGDVFAWLKRDGYTGWLSVEWEKRWHPELAPPEEILPQYAKAIRELWEHAEI